MHVGAHSSLYNYSTELCLKLNTTEKTVKPPTDSAVIGPLNSDLIGRKPFAGTTTHEKSYSCCAVHDNQNHMHQPLTNPTNGILSDTHTQTAC